MEELLKMLLIEKAKREKSFEDFKKNFRSAKELGLQQGDLIIYKDGETTCVDDPEDLGCRFKNIAEVKRPIDWETVEIRKPKRIRRKGAK